MLRTITLALTVLALLTPPTSVLAQQQTQGNRVGERPSQPTARFSRAEHRIILDFFANNRQQVRPLPPGIARNLARGKPLPRGIAKRAIPAALRSRLSGRRGADISILGDRVVLLDAAGLVVDILEGAFAGIKPQS